MRVSVKDVRRAVQTRGLRRHRRGTLRPRDEILESDETLDLWIRRQAITAHLVSSTCRMGTADDPTADVDQYWRVRGTQRLRVIDALIVPEAVRANWNLTVITMVELAADFVRES